jgi:hypothetical protein
MKKLVKVEEVEGEGLMALMGEVVHLYCCRYIYRGKLDGVNDDCVLLTDAGIVYETGNLQGKPSDFQKFSHSHYVAKAAIESFGKAPDA